jgi:LysM repeat protein
VGKTLRIPHKDEMGITSQKSSFQAEKNQPISHFQSYSDGTYVVQRGDSLFSIAKKFEIPFSELQAINNIDNPRNLQIGKTLIIPQKISSFSITPITTVTQTTNAEIDMPSSSTSVDSETMMSTAQNNYPSRYQFMDDADFYVDENIDSIPVIQIRKE